MKSGPSSHPGVILDINSSSSRLWREDMRVFIIKLRSVTWRRFEVRVLLNENCFHVSKRDKQNKKCCSRTDTETSSTSEVQWPPDPSRIRSCCFKQELLSWTLQPESNQGFQWEYGQLLFLERVLVGSHEPQHRHNPDLIFSLLHGKILTK